MKKTDLTVVGRWLRRVLLLLSTCIQALSATLMLAGWTVAAHGQLNTDRLITIGRSALYYEDYVLSMQYFNQAIAAKPYLYEPWFFRAVAKYYLDDYAGAEADCTEALNRNPYVVSIYELRGLTRIQQKKFSEAAQDYNRALKYDPENRGLWHNRVLCRIQNEEFDLALAELDTIQQRWSQYAGAWAMRSDVYLQQKDTTKAIDALQRSIDLDPYDGRTWAARSQISLMREEWPEAEEQLNEAIRLMPKHAGCYINRALARFNQQNLRGAMADYDMALDIEPNNFLGHYNRGLLRAQVGDDNRAITDFDFVLRLEPDNMLALFNRGVLLDKTGDLKGAIRDYSKVIDEFPNFWTGLEFRAACYRRLGQTAKAEQDEFTVYKARLYKHLYGTQPRLDPTQLRKRSDVDPDKYNQLVVEDEQEKEHEYQNAYRGRVQNHHVEEEMQPMFALSLLPPSPRFPSSNEESGVGFSSPSEGLREPLVEALNAQHIGRKIYISAQRPTLDTQHAATLFQYIDSLASPDPSTRGEELSANKASPDPSTRGEQLSANLLLLRAIAYTTIQNYDDASDDLTEYLLPSCGGAGGGFGGGSLLALWQRAVCQARIVKFQDSEGTDTELRRQGVLADLNHALTLSPDHPFLLYNRGCIEAQRQDYASADADFTAAIQAEPLMAEAYFNRGLCRIHSQRSAEGIADLSKAGELGLYTAYSIIKKYR